MAYNNSRRKLYASGRVSALLLYGDLVATPNNLKYQKWTSPGTSFLSHCRSKTC